MRLLFERDLDAPPAAAWPFVSDPERMNRWSSAPIRSLAPGDGGGPAGVGALRGVRLETPLRTIELEEAIVASEPPARLVYRVVGGLPVRRHRGVVTLEPRGAGSRLRWEVDLELPFPGGDLLVRGLLEPAFAASLDALVPVVRGSPEEPIPPARAPVDETAELPALEAAAAACAARERAIADELEARGDPRRWFPRVYSFVTELQLEAARRGDLAHPGWVLRLVPAFHAYFERNLERARGLAGGPVEAHWRSAFRAMEEAPRWFPRDELRQHLYGVAKGMQAHIEEDLPRALAEVYARHYAGRCDYARLRADYLGMAWIFREAGDRLGRLIPRSAVPLRSRLLGAVLPREVAGRLLDRSFYDLPRERRRAFERGERIAAMLLARG